MHSVWTRRTLNFCKCFICSFRVFGLRDKKFIQNASNPPHQRLLKNFPMGPTIYSSVNILLNTTEYLKSYGGLFISITLYVPESPSKVLNCSSIGAVSRGLRCTCCMKQLWNPFACDADQRFHMKVKCPTGWASFWVKFHTVWSKPQVCPEGEGGWEDLVHNYLIFNQQIPYIDLVRAGWDQTLQSNCFEGCRLARNQVGNFWTLKNKLIP